jgi:hypothetical protein
MAGEKAAAHGTAQVDVADREDDEVGARRGGYG